MKKIAVLLVILGCLVVSLNAQRKENDIDYYAADQSVLIMPTAITMPQGTHALTSFEVVLLQYSYAITDNAHLSAGMVFPFTSEMFRTFSAGAKFRYYKENNINSAAWATISPDPMIVTVGNVLSYGDHKASVHAAAAGVFSIEEEDSRAFFGLGGIVKLGNRLNLMAELDLYPTTEYVFEENDPEPDEETTVYDAIGAVGFRFKGTKISWDLGAFRPLTEDSGDLIALPFLKATFLF